MLLEMEVKNTATIVHRQGRPRPGRVQELPVGIEQGDGFGLRNVLYPLSQKGMKCLRPCSAPEIIRGFNVRACSSGLDLVHDQIDHLHIAFGLFGEDDAHAVHAALMLFERRLVGMPDDQAGGQTNKRHDRPTYQHNCLAPLAETEVTPEAADHAHCEYKAFCCDSHGLEVARKSIGWIRPACALAVRPTVS